MCFSDPTRMELASADSARALIDVMEKHNREVIIESFQWEEVINYQLCMKRTRTLLDQYPDVDGIMALDLCAAAFLKTEKNKKYWLMMELMSRTSITIRLIQLYRMRRRLQRKV